jgi:hypothetical protein
MLCPQLIRNFASPNFQTVRVPLREYLRFIYVYGVLPLRNKNYWSLASKGFQGFRRSLDSPVHAQATLVVIYPIDILGRRAIEIIQ